MSYVPQKDPVTGMITMVKVGPKGRPRAAFWTALVGAPIPEDKLSAESREDALDAIAVAVFGGGSVSETIEDILEVETDETEEAEVAYFRTILEGYASTARAAHEAAAATWAGETDNDRIAKAFAEMNAAGIVARERLGQSLSDGEYDIDEIVDEMIANGETVRGNVFYHAQDAERAMTGGGLMLAFTGDRTGAEAARLIGNEIVAILERNGLKPVWNGDPDHRIKVDMEWRRRP